MAVPESVCQPGPATMPQHTMKGAVTSGRGKGKMSAKTVVLRSHGTGTKYGVLLLRTLWKQN